MASMYCAETDSTLTLLSIETAPLAGVQSRDIGRPTVPGAAFIRGGFRGEARAVNAMAACGNSPGLATTMLAINDLRGRLVTLTDDHGISWANVMVLDAQIDPSIILYGVGSLFAKTHLIRIVFILQPTASSY